MTDEVTSGLEQLFRSFHQLSARAEQRSDHLMADCRGDKCNSSAGPQCGTDVAKALPAHYPLRGKKMRNSRLYRGRKPCLGQLPMYIPDVDKVVVVV